MMLGKRPRRHPMKRTTSMTEFSFDDLSVVHPPPSSGDSGSNSPSCDDRDRDRDRHHQMMMGFVSPRPHLNRRNSADFALRPDSSVNNTFLRTCCLCTRRLAPARDIYMYSLECREQQMTQDEWKEKCTTKESNSSSHSTPVVSSTKSEKIAAL
ncbi:FCS-Like Zinc finger 5 isoform X1 [Spinacia oleracea]|uniref:FCS-Like Zinc finger 5 isoform X1 n=1 Tax=Spinacia oleracea TaxID=3562 RepID=A0A9R0KAZ5_SPIOL|nr:FCS-Like Zinc finger 5-like isoform X1 [Spinacia oleracea]